MISPAARAVRRKRRVALALLIWLACTRSALATDCVSDGRYVMGTVLEITLCAEQTAPPQQSFDSLFATATFLDSVLTTYSPHSPVSRLNAQAGRGPVTLPKEVVDLLILSRRYAQLTRGTFDITVGPLMALWWETAQHQTLPSYTALRQARVAVGSHHIRLSSNHTVVLKRPGMSIDFGGIGKGYALDQLVSQLKQQHIHRALLDFGQSSLWAVGAPPDATGWRILVQQPNGRPAGVVTLRDQALSVSASMGQAFEIKGQRYGHIIDPRTGHPLQRDLLACVIAPTTTQAEALSKALLILGEHEGLALLQRLPGVEGMLVETNGRQWMTPSWQQAVAFSLYESTP
jgi:thiamine biosynthesis lipoprotein